MKVKELIEYLKTQNQDVDVAFECYSEYCMLEAKDIRVVWASEPREDGWIHARRTDKPTRKYLMFPGN